MCTAIPKVDYHTHNDKVRAIRTVYFSLLPSLPLLICFFILNRDFSYFSHFHRRFACLISHLQWKKLCIKLQFETANNWERCWYSANESCQHIQWWCCRCCCWNGTLTCTKSKREYEQFHIFNDGKSWYEMYWYLACTPHWDCYSKYPSTLFIFKRRWGFPLFLSSLDWASARQQWKSR